MNDLAPGVIKVRAIGKPADIDKLQMKLVGCGAEILEVSGWRPADFGLVRAYLTIRLPQ